jgi:hypothetical protein
MSASTTARRTGSGWFTFAAIMFLIAGASNVLWGIAALDKKEYLPEDGLLFADLTAWGWVSLLWGLGQLVASVLLFTRNEWAGAAALVMATLSALFWLFAIPVLPIWSLIVISIDVLIVYQVAQHLDVLDE